MSYDNECKYQIVIWNLIFLSFQWSDSALKKDYTLSHHPGRRHEDSTKM